MSSIFSEIAARLKDAKPRGMRNPRLLPGEYIVRVDTITANRSAKDPSQSNVAIDGRVLVALNGASAAGSAFGHVYTSKATYSYAPSVRQLIAACLGVSFEAVNEQMTTAFFEKGEGSGKVLRVRAVENPPKPGSNKGPFLDLFVVERLAAKDYANLLTEDVVKSVFGDGDLDKGKNLIKAMIASGM